MKERQHCTPILLPDNQSKGQRLYHIPYGSPLFHEERLQELLAEHPELIPINEIEPAFSPLIFLGREVPCAAGAIDLLYTNPSGYLTVVETKLWDNPEARRQVVAQIVDYAAVISNWSFEELRSAINNSLNTDRTTRTSDILENLLDLEGDVEQSSYIDVVVRNLARGNFLLLIIGNGIREGVEGISGYIQKTPGLHFALALVEMNLYKLKPDKDYPLYIQPRTIARTVELVRAVVDIKIPSGFQISVDIPSEEEVKQGKSRRKITEQIFFDELAENSSVEVAVRLKDLMEDLYDLGLVSVWRSSSVSMRFPDPGGSGYRFTVIVLTITGSAYMKWLDRVSWPEYGGYDENIANNYKESVYTLAAKVFKELVRGEPFPIRVLLEVKEEYLKCVKRFTSAIIKESQEKADDV
jgi:hypothetical protein